MSSGSLQRHVFGQSYEGRPLVAFATPGAAPGPCTVVIGGIHGDEPATVELVEHFLAQLAPRDAAVLIPCANPDGFARSTRYNARGVDLNRNFPHRWSATSAEPPGPAPLSEPESAALRDFLERWRPHRVVSLHWALAEIEADGADGNALALHLWNALTPGQRVPYRLRLFDPAHPPEDFCPGSLGQWMGHRADRSHPCAMVTVELPYDPALPRPADPLPPEHLLEVHERWRTDRTAWLAAVRPGVEAMLRAAVR